ncbi:hypothetical protein [Paenibacillus sp. 1P03SA]|uniref:hypothetical protein n=1 Tax=Paenibacillus sp. 1P03SA TaxID=3132294 RepID=UPI0039A14330
MYKEDFYCLCKSYLNRHVRVQTKSGRTYDGVIIGVDPNYVRLRVSGPQGQGEGHGYTPYPEYGQGYISGHVNGYGKTRENGQTPTPEQTEERGYFYPPRPPFPGFPGYPGFPGNPPGYPGSGANDAILTLALFDLLTLVLLM